MNDFIVSLMLLGAVGSYDGALPFWATANQYGLMPERSGAMAWVKAGTEFDGSRTLQWRWGGAAALTETSPAAGGGLGTVTKADAGTVGLVGMAGLPVTKAGESPVAEAAVHEAWGSHLMLDELYASLRWQCFTLDVGQKRRAQDFTGADASLGSLSVTGGHVVESGNARPMPGYKITLAPLAVPFTDGHLKIYGDFGDYRTMDERFAQDALVHRMLAGVQASAGGFSLDLGLDHYALWGGRHPNGVDMNISLANYLRIITGRNAGSDASLSDQINVIGDHGGAEFIKLAYRGDGWKVTAQHEIPYADRSGMKFKNFPDGVNTLHFGFDRKDRWISDILYEYHYTMFQSGPINEEKYDEFGNPLFDPKTANTYGGDNYFNNGEYRSGWTHFGHSICAPLFFVKGTYDRSWSGNGVTLGFESNRYRAHHIGIGGMLFRKQPYKIMLTYSINHGTYGKPYTGESAWQKPWGTVKETGLRQVSVAFVGTVRNLFNVSGLNGLYGLYADKGSLLEDSIGVSLGIKYTL